MTRGTIVVITDDILYITNEFNGDMYLEQGYGEDVIKMFNHIIKYDRISQNRIVQQLNKFNKKHHNYQDFQIIEMPIIFPIVFLCDIYEKLFSNCIYRSDYTYVLNLSNKIKFSYTPNFPQKYQICVVNYNNLYKTIEWKQQ